MLNSTIFLVTWINTIPQKVIISSRVCFSAALGLLPENQTCHALFFCLLFQFSRNTSLFVCISTLHMRSITMLINFSIWSFVSEELRLLGRLK